tara:strand:- start:4569 stop:7463 length:2895 start_codon:yes stop_codon:yes gene_type:complete
LRTKIEVRDTDNSVLGVLDIGKDADFPISITKRLGSIKDISKRSGSYSKTFKIPATKANNRLLNTLYSSNQRNVKDMKNRKAANVLVDSKIIERGYLKVTNVEDVNGVKTYHCKFFGDNADWMAALSEVTLKDLTYGSNSTGDLTYNRTNITNTWDKVYGDNYDHVYAWINYGQYKEGHGLITEDMRPSVRYRAIIERSLSKAGYNLSSTFMDTADFKQLIFPFIGDNFKHSQAIVDNKLFRAASDKVNTDAYYADTGSTSDANGFRQILRFNDDSTAPNFDTGGNYNTSSYRYTIPTAATGNGKYRFAITAKLATGLLASQYNPTDTKISWHIWKNGSYLETVLEDDLLDNYKESKKVETGYYHLIENDYIEFKCSIYGTPAKISGLDNNGNWAVGDTLEGTSSGATATIYKIVNIPNNTLGYKYYYFENSSTTTGKLGFDLGGENVFKVGSPSDTGALFGYTHSYDYINFSNTDTFVELIDMSKELVEENTYQLANVMPEVKVLDLISDISKIFNLYWRTDTKTKTVYVEERDSFFKSYTTALNWTNKVAINKPYKLNFLESYNRDLIFKYAKDSNDKYLEKRNETFQYQNNLYCSYRHELPTRFPKGETTINTTQIAPTYIIHDPKAVLNYCPSFTFCSSNVSRYAVTARLWNEPNLDDSAPPPSYNFNPRILNYKYAAQTDVNSNSLAIDFKGIYTGDKWVNYTTIPAALPLKIWDNTVPYSLSFAQDNGLVLTYYGRTLGVIEDSLQLDLYLNLSDTDIQNLDMSKPVYFKTPEEIQGYWLIDTVHDYSPFKELTRVTLTKYHKNDSSGNKITIDTDSSPDPFPNPTGGDFPPDPINVIGHGSGTDGTETDGDTISRFGIVAQNGTDNRAARGSGSLAMGQGCVAKYKNQSMFGSYPEISNDIFAIGVGNENERITGLRADADGNVTIYGGEIYTINNNGERVPVYTEGSDKIRKIYLK